MKKGLILLFVGMLFLSCGTDFSSEASHIVSNDSEKKEPVSLPDSDVHEDEETDGDDGAVALPKWTILVYMAADNNLESSAITDFNELENAVSDDSVRILVLFDRAEKYDATNDDWTDTRLYEISHDSQLNKTLIVSECLDCAELGLKQGGATELDMGNPATLSGFVKFARRVYSAENYGLVIWGHGTGWRNDAVSASDSEPVMRAVALDTASDSYMTISQIRSALSEGLEGETFEFIGFDTCFGMCLECAYELSECASFMLGTPALVPESGWNYTEVFNQFVKSEQTTNDFIQAVSSAFADSYQNYSYASFSCVDLGKIPAIVARFSEYASSLAAAIASREMRDSVFSVFTKNCVSYHASEYPTDFYVDLYDVLGKLDSFMPSGEVRALIADALVDSWSAAGTASSLGLFFCIYKESGFIQYSHPSLYTNGSRDTLLSRFVGDCAGYVPTSAKNTSLLDKLFSTSF